MMGRRVLRDLVLGLVLPAILSVPPAFGGVITMETMVDPGIKDGAVQTTIRVTNKGDEAAQNVQIEMDLFGTSLSSPPTETLAPTQSHSVTLTSPVTVSRTGRYPVVVRVNYTDVNSYPFTASALAFLTNGDAPPSRLFGTLKGMTLSDKGRLEMTVKNLENTEKTVTARLILPKELTADLTTQEIVLSPGAQKVILTPITNLAALPGSTYTVFGLFEYEQGDSHYTTSVSGQIKVTAAEEVFRSFRAVWFWIAAGVLLLFVVVNAVVYIRSRRKRHAEQASVPPPAAP